jgi:hypothetical protein
MRKFDITEDILGIELQQNYFEHMKFIVYRKDKSVIGFGKDLKSAEEDYANKAAENKTLRFYIDGAEINSYQRPASMKVFSVVYLFFLIALFVAGVIGLLFAPWGYETVLIGLGMASVCIAMADWYFNIRKS